MGLQNSKEVTVAMCSAYPSNCILWEQNGSYRLNYYCIPLAAMQIRVHNAFPNSHAVTQCFSFKPSLESLSPLFATPQDSSFKALWLSPDLKSSSPPSFLHRNKKKNPANEFFIFSTNPNKCHRGAKDFIFSNFCSGFGLVLSQFSQSSPW